MAKQVDLSLSFRKLLCFFFALIMAGSVVLSVSIGVASGLLRTESFIQARYEKYNDMLLKEVNQALEGVAEQTGLPAKAYTSAIKSGHIRTALHQAANNTVKGFKTDFSESTFLYSYYHAGLLNYCKENGIPISEDELNRDACFAVDTFNSVVGDESTSSIIIFSLTYTKHPLLIIIGCVIAFIASIVAVDFISYGRHKKFDYIGVGLITAGETLIIMPIFAILMKYTSTLRFMDIAAFNAGLADVLNDIMKIYVAIGVVVLILGITIIVINYAYYHKKIESMETERKIRKKIIDEERASREAKENQ